MGHPASLSGKVHKGEAITAMSIITVLCDIAPPHIIETLATLAAPLSVQAFLRGDDAILVSHSLPCLAAMATGQMLFVEASILLKTNAHQFPFLHAYWTKLIVLAPFPKAYRPFRCVSETTLAVWCAFILILLLFHSQACFSLCAVPAGI